jgi:hypothetical protein
MRLSYDKIRILNVTLTGTELPTGKIHKEYERDFDVMSNQIQLMPVPVYRVAEVRVQKRFPSDATLVFGPETVLSTEDWYKPKEGKFGGEVDLRADETRNYSRRRGFINAQPVRNRRVARVLFYVGTTSGIDPDLSTAIVLMAQQVAVDPSGDAQSESLDYYSISKRSLAELTNYPSSAISTFMRYKVS